MEAIRDFPSPANRSALRSFLGLANTFQQWLPDLSLITCKMRGLLRINRDYVWGPDEEEEFIKAKLAICASKHIRPFDPNMKTLVIADTAKLLRVGYCLVQVQPSWREGDSLAGCSLVWCGSLAAKESWKNFSPLETEL